MPFRYDTTSSQYEAYQWLIKDPNFWTYDQEKMIQRWVMAMLSFEWTATGGDLEMETRSILGEDPLETWGEYTDECDWWNSYNLNEIPCSEAGIVKRIVLINIGLQGTIPSEISMLTKLSKLFFFSFWALPLSASIHIDQDEEYSTSSY